MKLLTLLLTITILCSCYKEEVCDFYTFSSSSTTEGVYEVTNRFRWGSYSPENCEKLAKEKRESMSGLYLWYGHEVTPEEIVFCDCKN